MARLYLSLSDELSKTIHEEAQKQKMTDTAFAEKILLSVMSKKGLFSPSQVDISVAVNEMVQEAEKKSIGEEFTVYELDSFKKYAIGQYKNGEMAASALRARIGKKFNEAVRKGMVHGVTAMTTTNRKGETVAKKRDRDSLYHKE